MSISKRDLESIQGGTSLSTLEELYAREDDAVPAELWEGAFVEMPPAGEYHNLIAIQLVAIFLNFCRKTPGLRCSVNNGFAIRRNPDTFFIPDVCLYKARPSEPWLLNSPEIAVEIISPSNSKPETASKKDAYLRGGSEQVWIIDPGPRTVVIYFRDQRVQVLKENHVVICEGIAEGMEVTLAEVFDDSLLRS